MAYLRSFAPWIIYAALSPAGWRAAVCAAAVAAGALVGIELRQKDLDPLNAGAFGFFAVMAVIALAMPESGLRNWTWALSNGTLAVIAAGSLLARRPFTLALARRSTPREWWQSPALLHANSVITAVWTSSFAALAVTCALIIHADHTSTWLLVAVQGPGIAAAAPLVITKIYAGRKKATASPARLDTGMR